MSQKHKSEPSSPNMILTGHQSQPTYALGWSNVKPIVASGGGSGDIVLWNLEGQISVQSGFGGFMTPNTPAPNMGGLATNKYEENKSRGAKTSNG